ncbi:MAG: GNAT family N-acetyltransferase [Candidatus Kapabacteria bacterium]|jgi:RimJ/RimL family protein N-acetyltransferase|nr:GNAT family N-acetyltransferase [Candidatus Kapabacteria bacterium]
MTTSSIIIRRVRIDEAAQFRDLRLASLQEMPDAFASSYEEEEHWTAEFYAERQRSQPDNFIIGAFDNTTLVGMVGFFRERFRKTRHVGIIWGMYVRPEYRRQNIGEKMLHYLLDEARTVQGIEQVHLGVVSTIYPAKSLYEKCGFQLFGEEKNAMKDQGKYFSVFHYALFL